MISKVLPAARSFRCCCQYVCQDQSRSRVLKAEGVRGHDYRLMAKDFEHQRLLRPEKHQAVFHGVLSFFPEEKPDDQQMVAIAEKYLERIGVRNTQYVIAKHTDRGHLHMHVIGNRVDNEGRSIEEGWMGLRGKKAAQQLTREYKLTPAVKKNLHLTHEESLQPSEAKRYQIYHAIREHLPKSEDLADLERRLLKQGIDTQYKYNPKTQQPEGISFRLEKQCFKGSQIDREFSLKGLEKQILQQRLVQEIGEERHIGRSHSHRHSF